MWGCIQIKFHLQKDVDEILAATQTDSMMTQTKNNNIIKQNFNFVYETMSSANYINTSFHDIKDMKELIEIFPKTLGDSVYLL